MTTFILLIVFIKISIHYNNPLVIAMCYTALTTLINAVLVAEPTVVFISSIATFALTWFFFWLLDRFEDSNVWWLIVFLFPWPVLFINSAF